MADKINRPRKEEVFWASIGMHSSDEDAYIPGLSAPGNKRPGRVKARKTKEVRANFPATQPIIEDSKQDFSQSERHVKGKLLKPTLNRTRQSSTSFPAKEKQKSTFIDDSGMSTTFESFAERSIRRLQKASLKDLRPEDKQRVANLIKELARVGEEKEMVVKELQGEREQYEKQLMTMVEQQEKILQEREDVQEKLFQCQKLLTEYQAQLLNKRERLNTSIHEMQEEQPRIERQSRSREPVSRQATSQNTLDEYLTNQHAGDESVSDLLLNPIETVKRPYTSMIDKEIAKERSLSRGSRTSDYSRSRSASPSEGRPRFAYPQKLSGIGPLHEPLASSTQKSMEIRAQNLENESQRSKSSNKNQQTGSKGYQNIKSFNKRDDSPADSDSAKNRVAFNDKNEYDDNAEKHSPTTKSPAQMFNDPEYAQYYKKLSPGGRKRELLKQRQALLDEQERLRVVLEKQERQLQVRKYEYDKRKELQEQRMEFYKEGGKFPALKLDFDHGSEKGSVVDDKELVEKRAGSFERCQTPDVEMDSPRSNIEIDDEVKVRSRVSMGTSPLATPPPGNKVTIATSPVHSAEMLETETPRFIDVATSVSYRTPLKDTSNRVQGNLPLACNRQRSSPFTKQGEEVGQKGSVRTPGEKTLNVLELVNSIEEEPPASVRHHHSYEDLENKPDRLYTPNKYITQGKGAQSSPYRQYTSPANLRTSQGKLFNDEEESLEENKMLEDIFFL